MSLIDLRFGRWQDVLADVTECDTLITDPPYSPRQRLGYRGGVGGKIECVDYGSIDSCDALELAAGWYHRTNHWAAIFGCHVAFRWHEESWSVAGWNTFAPVIWLREHAPPRFAGDGPTNAVDHICIARPRRRLDPERSGSRPSWYRARTCCDRERAGIVGQKSIDAMRALIRDYTRRGDLVVDPYAGSGTTAIACAIEGRRCITAECDPKHYEIARKRIAAGHTMDLLANVTP